MKNVFKVLGIIALVTIIGFSMAACDDESGDDTDGEPDTGRLLLTDIPEKYNGGYISIPPLVNSDKSIRLGGFQSYDGSKTTYVKVSNGKANIPIWTLKGYIVEEYYGNDTVTPTYNFIYIFKEPTSIGENTELARGDYPSDPIVFVNGFAEKSIKNVYWFVDNVE